MRTHRTYLGIIAVLAALMSATLALASGGNPSATADIINTTGVKIGTATFTELGGDNVRVDVEVSGLEPGKHGAHIHSVGNCTTPGFASAGGHFNPDGHQHGRKNELGPHAGDLRNLVVGENGAGRLHQVTDSISLTPYPNADSRSLFDADSSAIVIHAFEDDEHTNPTGNSGPRVACGVIRAAS